MGFITDKLFLVASGIIAVLCVVLFVYFKISQNQIEKLSTDLAATQTALKVQADTIDQLQNTAKNQKIAIESLQNQTSQAENDRAKLTASVRNLNIAQSAKSNRAQLQTNINTQLNGLFSSVSEASRVRTTP